MVEIVFKDENRDLTLILGSLLSLIIFYSIIMSNPLLYLTMAIVVLIFYIIGLWKPLEWYSALLIGSVIGYLLSFAIVVVQALFW